MIDVIVPVLSRPGNAQPLIDSIRANTTVEHTITFMVSPDDHAELKACEQTDADIYIVEWQPGPADASKKWNLGYTITENPFVFTAADDITFTPGWDTEALKVAEKTGAGMVGTNDDANPLVKRGRHSTHSLFSRAYIDTVGGTFFDGPGIIYCQQYRHQWIDTEAVKAAMDRRQWAFAHQSLVVHHHPIYDRSVKMDDTYTKALGDARQDKQLYEQRLRQWSQQRRQGAIV